MNDQQRTTALLSALIEITDSVKSSIDELKKHDHHSGGMIEAFEMLQGRIKIDRSSLCWVKGMQYRSVLDICERFRTVDQLTADVLLTVPGVGPVMCERLLEWKRLQLRGNV